VRNRLFVLLFVLCTCSLYSREFSRNHVFRSVRESDWGVGGKLGYSYFHSSYAEAGIIVYKPLYGLLDKPWGFYGLVMGYEARIGGSKFVSGPKLAFEMHGVGFGGRAGLSFLTDYQHGSLQFSPEAGLSFVGLIYVFGGYNWTISNKDFWSANGPRLSVGINFYALSEFL